MRDRDRVSGVGFRDWGLWVGGRGQDQHFLQAFGGLRWVSKDLFWVWGLEFGFGVWGLWFGVCGLGFGIRSSGFRIYQRFCDKLVVVNEYL